MNNTLSKEAKALALKLAMQIDLGVINLETVLHYVNKDPGLWTPILAFWQETNDMTRMVVDRLVLEQIYLN